MTAVMERVITLLPKQDEFLRATEREVLYSGAFRAGKSFALCCKLVYRAQTPGAREGLCRKYLVSLKATTLRTLLDGDGVFPPVLPLGSYVHNKSDKTIRLNEGGEIVYFGLDEIGGQPAVRKVGSYSLTGCGVDEAEELTEADWTTLRGRVSVTVPDLPQQLYGATNPGAPSHHLAVRFGLAGGAVCSPNCKAVITRSSDNHYLAPEYLADLATFTGLAHKRYVLGQWAGSDKLVYDTWDRAKFVQARPDVKWRRTIVGRDVGYQNPGCMLLMQQDGDGRIHVAKEIHERKVLPAEWITRAREWAVQYGPETYTTDPSSPEEIAAFRAAGLNATAANNERKEGVRLVRAHMIIAGDGKPRLTVDPSCVNTIREFETWETKPDVNGRADEFTKDNDHAMDALRYGVMYLVSSGGQSWPAGYNPFPKGW